MKTLIASDVHTKVYKLEALLNAVPHDRWGTTGDWFDDWGDSPEANARTAAWIKKHTPDIHILGNHDQSYGFAHLNRNNVCSGFTKDKHKAIWSVLGPDDWAKFTLHAWVDDWLVSHAGLTKDLFRYVPPDDYRPVIDMSCASALRDLRNADYPPMVRAGSDRGGRQSDIGGITWIDWRSFQPVPYLNQLVGHTFSKELRKKCDENSQNFCLDTGFRHFAIIEDGRLSVYETADFIGKSRKTQVALPCVPTLSFPSSGTGPTPANV